jgi:MFS family permease
MTTAICYQGFKSCFVFSFLGGMADAAAWGSVVSILMKLFPNHVTTIASWTEMLLGLGYMLGNDKCA